MSEFKFEIKEEVRELGKPTAAGWGKVLTVTQFGDGEPKLDVRSWNEDFTCMGKGVTLSNEEALNLMSGLYDYFKEKGTDLSGVFDESMEVEE